MHPKKGKTERQTERRARGEGRQREGRGGNIYAWVLFGGITASLLEQCVTTDFALSLV